jgi:hypothetical protein
MSGMAARVHQRPHTRGDGSMTYVEFKAFRRALPVNTYVVAPVTAQTVASGRGVGGRISGRTPWRAKLKPLDVERDCQSTSLRDASRSDKLPLGGDPAPSGPNVSAARRTLGLRESAVLVEKHRNDTATN